ncbi:MAG TPA: AMP-binding protein [Pseudonocardiaceae bacterium]|nr:AMP-binding protein [Pseudonocardiaceae bacterium]
MTDERLSLSGWFARAVARNPDGTALVAPGGSRTFRELDAVAGALAATIRTRLGRRPARIAVFGERTAGTFEAYLAALYTGATVVPLSPEMPVERNIAIASGAGIDVLLYATTERATNAIEVGEAALGLPGVLVFDTATEPSDGYLREQGLASTDVAYLVFTSGSSGRPKGVPISHGNIDAYLRAVADRFRPSPGDVFSQIHELTFDYSVFEMWVAWSGAACVSSAPRVQALNTARMVNDRGITFLSATPSMIEGVLSRERVTAGSMPGLRYAVCSGEPLRELTVRAWSAAAPNAVVDNLYGPTELTVTCTGYRWRPGVRGVEDMVPIGVMHPTMDHILLDPSGELSERDGQLCVRGPQMFAGYLDPRDDAGRFVEIDGHRWYCTGDRIRIGDDGLMYHRGRIDAQVKVRGYRVELSEVEAAVRGLVAGSVMAVDVTDGADTSLVVFVATPAELDVPGLLASLAGTLPPYMVPARVFTVPELPTNKHDKADRGELRRRAEDLLGAARR